MVWDLKPLHVGAVSLPVAGTPQPASPHLLKMTILTFASKMKEWQRRTIPFWNMQLPRIWLTWKRKHWPFFGNAGIKQSTHYALVQSASYGQQRSCGIFHKSKRFATLLLARVSCLPLLCLMGLCYLLQGWRRFMVLYINSSKKDSEHRETDWEVLYSS